MGFYRMELAERIKQARELVGLTQVEAARRLHVSSASLAAYEQGARDVPDATIEQMALVYGTSGPMLRYGEEVLRAAATGEVDRRIRQAAESLQQAASALLATLPDVSAVMQSAKATLADLPPEDEPDRPKTGRAAPDTTAAPAGTRSGSGARRRP